MQLSCACHVLKMHTISSNVWWTTRSSALLSLLDYPASVFKLPTLLSLMLQRWLCVLSCRWCNYPPSILLVAAVARSPPISSHIQENDWLWLYTANDPMQYGASRLMNMLDVLWFHSSIHSLLLFLSSDLSSRSCKYTHNLQLRLMSLEQE